MEGLGKLRIALTVVFALLLAALFAAVLYVLWRRNKFHRQTLDAAAGDPAVFSPDQDPTFTPSKELLYFFCWKKQSRVEPDAAPPRPDPTGEPRDRRAEVLEDLEKWQRLYSASRLLFTIREEEREGLESDYSSSTEKGRKTRTVSMDDGFAAGSLPEVVVTIQEDEEEATPFATPCASPPYYTPSPSPTREFVGEVVDVEGSPGNVAGR